MEFLKNINSPNDLRQLSLPEMKTYANEIRNFLVSSISKTGGHLASNLGVVELTLAIHYCFDSPTDKIIFDVGHQAYVHKIITGRLSKFDTLRKLNGLSGFPKKSESAHDVFETGHSSTSISVAMGYCLSRDLKKENNHVISVIGDGSMTGGLAYEALNNAGRSNTNLIVILNDNQMSISENVGAMSKNLSRIRTEPTYLDAKADVKEFLNKIPIVGERVGKIIEKTKEGIKYLLVPGVLFEELGFNYIGPIDGHNLSELIAVLDRAKKMKGPILLHVYTKKGKGYKRAENSPAAFHGVDSFNVKTGQALKAKDEQTYSDVFGETLSSLAAKNKKIVAVTAAMASGTGLGYFQTAFPDRTFDVGIAEGHAVTFSAGMAINGLIPVFAVYSTFLQRAYDQIVHDVCLQNLHVIFAIDRAGIVGADGETHQGVFDLSFLSHIPNMTVVAPKNKNEFIQMLGFAINYNGPIAIRYPRAVVSNILTEHKKEIILGKSEVIEECVEENESVAIISVGAMMDTAYGVFSKLKENNVSAALINARFIKPIDTEMVVGLGKYKYVFVMEDNLLSGGFGSKVLEEMCRNSICCPHFYIFAFPDKFIEQGSRTELLNMYGLDETEIYKKIVSMMESSQHGNEKA